MKESKIFKKIFVCSCLITCLGFIGFATNLNASSFETRQAISCGTRVCECDEFPICVKWKQWGDIMVCEGYEYQTWCQCWVQDSETQTCYPEDSLR